MVDLNKVAIQVAEVHRAFTDVVNKACDVFSLIEDEADKARCENDFDVAINKADEVFSLIEDADEKEAYYKPFDDGINQAEVALANAAGWVQTEVITNLTFQE